MSDLKASIELAIRKDLAQRYVVDISEVASSLESNFPEIAIPELQASVFEAVVNAKGNAIWEKERPIISLAPQSS